MLNSIAEAVRKYERFLIVTHVKPDGDALGSSLALWHVLRTLGKEAVVLNQDETPENYRFLPGAEAIVHTLGEQEQFDVSFILDCGDLARVGNVADRAKAVKIMINVDHHLVNGLFCDFTLNDPTASSTGELLYRILAYMSVAIPSDAANCLYAAILTDTGGFRYACTSKETMLAAGELIGSGANPQWLSENIYENSPLIRILLMTKVLETLAFDSKGRIGSLVVYNKALEEIGARPEHTEGFVDIPRSIRGVEVSILFSELENDSYKVSLRSKDKVNVELVARTFGGGGHLNAASCLVSGNIAAVKHQVFNVINEIL